MFRWVFLKREIRYAHVSFIPSACLRVCLESTHTEDRHCTNAFTDKDATTSKRSAHLLLRTTVGYHKFFFNWPLATLWVTGELSQLPPACKHASLDSKQNMLSCCVRKQHWSTFELCKSKRDSNPRGVIYFACLSGRSYLSPGERSIVPVSVCYLLIKVVEPKNCAVFFFDLKNKAFTLTSFFICLLVCCFYLFCFLPFFSGC